MSETVHILATCRKPELLPATLLVFKTLRVGFPTAKVQVWGNALTGEAFNAVEAAAQWVKGEFVNLAATVHDQWIESLVLESFTPFWICDTDMVFFGSMENLAVSGNPALVGRYEPEWEVDGTRHMARLHTCCLQVNPNVLRADLRGWMAKFPPPWNRVADYPLVRHAFVPLAGEPTRFYDTLAGAYHAVGGTPFTEEQDSRFEHLHCGTWVDLLPDRYGLKDLRQLHQAIYDKPELARGLREGQRKYYEDRKPKGVEHAL